MGLPLTTTLANYTGHNTSANPTYDKAHFPANFTGQTWIDTSHTVLAVDSSKSDDGLNPVTPGHVSPVSVKTLIPGLAGFAKAHWQGWFRTGGGGGHKDIGINSQSPTYIASMIADMMRRGADGLTIDWYGQGSYSDGSALALKAYLATHPGFTYAIQIDSQAYTTTAQLNAHLAYIQATYFGTTGYQQQGGKPCIWFFGSVGGVNYATAKATIAASHWFTQGSGSLANAWTDSAFDWVQPYATGVPADRYNDAAKNSFLTAAHSSTKGTVVHIAAGFDGYLSTWKQGWLIPRDNGKCWLHQAGVNAANLPTNCIGLHFNWDDYEEGTQVETGIDNGISLSASITGNTFSWSVSGGTGDESTISEYVILASPDGTNAAVLGTQAVGGSKTFDLTTIDGWGTDSYWIYVVAVGVACVRNHISSGQSYIAPVTITVGGGGGTVTVSVTTGEGSVDFQPLLGLVKTKFLAGDFVSDPWIKWFGLIPQRFNGLVTTDAPASSTSPGKPGEIRQDGQFVYVCIAKDTWKRASLNTF